MPAHATRGESDCAGLVVGFDDGATVTLGGASAVVGAPGASVSLGPADAYEPRPVLCIQPMTAADARYQEGRRAGLLEAAAGLEASAKRLEVGETDAAIMRTAGVALDQDGAPVSRAAAECLRQLAQRLEAAVRAVKP